MAPNWFQLGAGSGSRGILGCTLGTPSTIRMFGCEFRAQMMVTTKCWTLFFFLVQGFVVGKLLCQLVALDVHEVFVGPVKEVWSRPCYQFHPRCDVISATRFLGVG